MSAGAEVAGLGPAIDAVRLLAIDAIEEAGSGHPGICLGAAPMATVLWARHLAFDPGCPGWIDRDRFVLSAGHGSALLYALLHLAGYDLPLAELRRFRTLGSRTPGHPEYGVTPGVEATTGPLGQGAANAVGMAMAEAHLAARFNRPGQAVVDHRTWALLSDGDMMEGVVHEAASIAGHLGLGKLTFLYDANGTCLGGPVSACASDDTAGRFVACGWRVAEVRDGDHDLAAIDRALAAAAGQSRQPSLIVVRTTIGCGAPTKQGQAACHGSPLGAGEAAALRAALGQAGRAPFSPAPAGSMALAAAGRLGAARRRRWRRLLAAWRADHPDLAAAWRRRHRAAGAVAAAAPEAQFAPDPAPLSTREAGRRALTALAPWAPGLVTADADLAPSTLARVDGGRQWHAGDLGGDHVCLGVREHGMAGVLNGMAYHGGIRPVGSTYLVFSDYLRPALRLAALAGLPVIYVFSHDSVALGEDGPTHQPIEQLAALRAMPGLTVIRPADARETFDAWRVALAHRRGPVALVLSRQPLPPLPGPERRLGRPRRARPGRPPRGSPPHLARGAYLVSGTLGGAQALALLIATGAEVHLALAAQARLAARGIPAQVVSMPSWELFASATAAHRRRVLPPAIPCRLAIEAGSAFGWERWVGQDGDILALERFGASGAGETVLAAHQLTAEHAADRLEARLAAASRRPAAPAQIPISLPS